MSKICSTSFNDRRDSGISIEKEFDEVRSPLKNSRPVRRQEPLKGGFKSLTALSAKDSLENLQKIRRRNETRRTLNRGSANSKERGKKKYTRKKFDKPHVSEANIRKVSGDLVNDELEINKKLVTIVHPRDIQNNHGKHSVGDLARNLDEQSSSVDDDNSSSFDSKNEAEIAEYFEKLRISDGEHQKSVDAQNPGEANKSVEHGSGDQQHQDEEFSLEELEELEDGAFAGMACAEIFDSKRRSVQWKREVEVIYYAGDARGGKVVRRENEPLQEESDQQARRKRFIQLALTKNILSGVSACQLRDPWLVVLPK